MGLGRKVKIACFAWQTLVGLIFIGVGIGIGYLFLTLLEDAFVHVQKIHCTTNSDDAAQFMDPGAEACNTAFEDSDRFKKWVTTNRSDAAAIYTRFHLFDLDNLESVITGADPTFTQRGPYVFREHVEKYDVEFSIDSSEVSFHEHTRYEFDADLTAAECSDCGDPATDTVTTFYSGMYTAIQNNFLGDEMNLFSVFAATGVATVALPATIAAINTSILATDATYLLSNFGVSVDPIAQWGGLQYSFAINAAVSQQQGWPVPSNPSEAYGFKTLLVASGFMDASDDELELPRWAVENAPADIQALCNLDFNTGNLLGNTALNTKISTCYWTVASDAISAITILTGAVPNADFPTCAGAATPNIIAMSITALNACNNDIASCNMAVLDGLAVYFGVPRFDGASGHSPGTTLLVLLSYGQALMQLPAVQSAVLSNVQALWTAAGVPVALQASQYPKIWQTKTIQDALFFDYSANYDAFLTLATCATVWSGTYDNYPSVSAEKSASLKLGGARDWSEKFAHATGQDNWRRSGTVLKHEGHSQLPSWSTSATGGYYQTEDHPPSALISSLGGLGKSGFFFPPGKAKSATEWENRIDSSMWAWLYKSSAYRALTIRYLRDSQVYGIDTLQFGIGAWLAVAEDPVATNSNKEAAEVAFFGGDYNFSAVFNLEYVYQHFLGVPVPIYVTQPHYMDVPSSFPKYAITAPSRAAADKMTLLDVDPVSGQTLKAVERIQTNFHARDVVVNTSRLDMTGSARHLVPILWSERAGQLRKKDADDYKNTALFILKFQKVMFLACVIFGSLWAPLMLWCTCRHCKAKKRETLPVA